MRNNAVVVADDDTLRGRNLVKWLRACGIAAYTPSTDCRDKSTLAMIHEVRPRLIVCRPGETGITLFRPLRAMRQPPMVILLRENPQACDEVNAIDELIVASIRAPVPMPGLCAFIRTALAIVARLDAPSVPTRGRSPETPPLGHAVGATARAMQAMVQAIR